MTLSRLSLIHFVVCWAILANAATGPATDPPPPYLEPSSKGRMHLSSGQSRLELGARERELMQILLEGCFENPEAKEAAFDRFLNRLSEIPKGELFDLLQNRWRVVDEDGAALIQGWVGNELHSQEWIKELSHLIDQLTEGNLRYQSVLSFGKTLDREIQKIRTHFTKSQKVAAMDRFEDLFEKAIGEINDLIRGVVDSGSVVVADPAYANLFRTVIVEYFSRLSFGKKKRILSDLLKLSSNADFSERLAVLFQNAGPQFQKMMQALARDPALGAEFSEVLIRLESNVKTVDFSVVHSVLLNQLTAAYPAQFSSLAREPLGSGTMAQIHLATLKNRDLPAVVRILKPEAAQSLFEDQRIFEQIIPLIESHPLSQGTELERFGQFARSFFEAANREMNASLTAEQQQKAAAVYSRVLRLKPDHSSIVHLRVPQILHPEWVSPSVLIQEMAAGVSMSRFFEFDPRMRRLVSEALALVWVEEAVFRSGFFHADLHQGNVKVSRNPDNSLVVSLLDFGMTGELSLRERVAFLKLSAGVEFSSRIEIRSALRELLIKSLDPSAVDEVISKVLRDPKPSVPMLIKQMVRIGAEFPPSFVAFSRGNWLLTQMLAWSGSDQSVDKLALKALRRGLWREAPARLGHLLLADLRYRGSFLPLSNAELIRLGLHQGRSSCSKALGKLLNPLARP
jgi:hypothetical protein